MEDKLLKWIGYIIPASTVLFVGSIFSVAAVLSAFEFTFESLYDPNLLGFITLFLLYILSVFFLYSAVDKGQRKKRVIAWAQSTIFHFILVIVALIYLLNSGEGVDAMILLSPEIIIGLLSLWGLLSAKNSPNKVV